MVRDGIQYVRDVVKLLLRDRGLDFAASVAFRVVLAIFPAVVLTLSILGLFGATGVLEEFLETLEDGEALPDPVIALLKDMIEDLGERAPRSLSMGAAASLGLAAWALSSAFRAMMTGLNVMYDVEDQRSTIPRFLQSLVMSVVAVAMLLVATWTVVGGRGVIGRALGLIDQGEDAGWAWALVRWPVLVLLVLLAVSLVYSFAPADGRRFRLITPGTVTAVVLWLAFALGFSQWVNRFSDYGQLYGALAGVAVLMLYVFWSAVLLFIGAEVDHLRSIRRERRSQAAANDAPTSVPASP
jgi:membrane protein